MSDPISRLAFARQEIDRVFGEGYAQTNPNVVAAVMESAALDFAAFAIANSLQQIAAALTEDEHADHLSDIIRKQHGLLR